MARQTKTIQFVFILTLVIIFLISANCGASGETKTPSSQLSNLSLHGFNLTAWQKNGWRADLPVDEALHFAIDEGANCITFDWAVNFNNDGTIVANGDRGPLHPPFGDIKTVVAKAKGMGLYVILKPHVTMKDNAQNRNLWNTKVNEFKTSNFFPAWKTYLIDLAAFATQNKVDTLCIGTELNHIDWSYKKEWVNLIAELRIHFSGTLTYDALFSLWRNAKDLKDVVFWDKAGIPV